MFDWFCKCKGKLLLVMVNLFRYSPESTSFGWRSLTNQRSCVNLFF